MMGGTRLSPAVTSAGGGFFRRPGLEGCGRPGLPQGVEPGVGYEWAELARARARERIG